MAVFLLTVNSGFLAELVWAQSPPALPFEPERSADWLNNSPSWPSPKNVKAGSTTDETERSQAEPVTENAAAADSESAPSSDSDAETPDGEELEEIDTEGAPADTTELSPSPEDLARRQLFMQADQLFLSGNTAAAERLYQQAKQPLPTENLEQPEPVLSAENLSPAAEVYWREAQTGAELGLETRTLVPLKLLVEQSPEFIPGHIRYAQALIEYDRLD
ncbi:MAG: hypothetical protein HC839_07020, partial [Leptolyngbyaceae cyanobacterium RM2_2_21]|nr:hypothetical protein [Leptolyngbyaceae cyanobacterium RM2_2_21]